MNAAAALYVSGIVGSIRQAIPIAEDAIDSGKVMVKFNQFRAFTSGFNRQDNENALQGKGNSTHRKTKFTVLSPET
jgi:anthranilate phosphoribosyltransferase